jgi:prophage regulatory protein
MSLSTTATRTPAASLTDVVQAGEGAPLVVDADGFGHLLGWSGRTTRRKDSAGLIPRPVRCGGAVRWRAEEIRRWVAAGCPDRAAWERRDRE